MHRGIARLVLVLVGFFAAVLMGFGPAQAEGPSITAIVTGADKAPISGVTVNVTGPDGFTGSGETDAEGQATIEVPAGGKYTATVDVATLPVGVEVKSGPERTINVLQGDKTAVDELLTNPKIKSVSFVGSTPIAQYVYATGTTAGKREAHALAAARRDHRLSALTGRADAQRADRRR